MSLIHFSLQHGLGLIQAKQKLSEAVTDLDRHLKGLVQQVEWFDEGSRVVLRGPGYHVEVRVDETVVDVEGDIPLVARLLAGPAIEKMKQALERSFQKKLQ